MLARLAENLFWSGRYVERAEDTARMVDVTYHGLLESPPSEVAAAWAQLLDVLHLRAAYRDHYGEVEATDVIRFLVLDDTNPGSMLAAIGRARENGRSVRELVSLELWEAVNGLYLDLRARDLEVEISERPYELFSFVKRRCQMIVGVATETMPRDDGWRFLTLGRMLERAEMTCRLLNVRFQQLASAAPMEFHHWVAVLKSASGVEAFRKGYRASMQPADVVEFLLLSPDFPRSVLFAVQAAEHQLVRLSDEGGVGTRARRLVGRLRASLEYTSVDELMGEGLHGFLDEVQAGTSTLADAVASEYFQHRQAGGFHIVATS
ncbi:MAG: alpha-E domain-containing protein [Actinobacteria bacterium]|nr:alpha-E domain-containing protein [Actinomycetota bacterium]